MTKLVASLLFPILLLFVVVLGENNNKVDIDTIYAASFTWKDVDVEEKNCSSAQLGESSFALMHAQGKCSPHRLPNSTWFATIMGAIEGDANRYRSIIRRGNTEKLNTDVPLASGRAINTGNYIIKLVFGTPGQSFYTALDTGSDITWIPCAPCSACRRQVFQPSKSSTYNYLSCASKPCQDLGINCAGHGNSNCSITLTYGDGSEVDELLSSDTLALGSQSQQFVFGCAYSLRGIIDDEPGLVGFGRGATSFVLQTAKLYDTTFSYCLPSLFSRAFTGSLQLGKGALTAPGLKFTSLLSNAANPSFYYVRLNGISVGEERVSIPAGTFEMDQSTGKGIIIDSGTVITRLVEPAYNPVRDSFRRQLSSLTMVKGASRLFDTCYKTRPSGQVNVPPITLHFDNSLDLTLSTKNTLIPVNNQGSVLCLAFALPPDDGSGLSIIGNYQQQNFRVVYDVAGSRLGFAPQNCDG
ncbi:hypothetical protein KI387_041619 [Taxus chinensis]|uniref:Peptidase A1 domain-containing protein n=1 Tax=Taxus chinensis TaxID=29808 RepID=A0AA38C441_TAXCH|nr:hypothetical protein KI387_041619 [Taxus chinensis]